MFRRWNAVYFVWVEAGEKGKEPFHCVIPVLDMIDLRSSKHPRRGPDLQKFLISILFLLLLETTGYSISLWLFTRCRRG